MNKKVVAGIAVILGIVFIIFGIVYLTNQAQSLPSFLPGYQAGLTKIHGTHGIASLFLGLACFAFARVQSGKKKKTSENSTPAERQ